MEKLSRDNYIQLLEYILKEDFYNLLSHKGKDEIFEIARNIADNFKTPDGVYTLNEVVSMYYDSIINKEQS